MLSSVAVAGWMKCVMCNKVCVFRELRNPELSPGKVFSQVAFVGIKSENIRFHNFVGILFFSWPGLIGLGFPVAATLSWIFNLTPTGLVPEPAKVSTPGLARPSSRIDLVPDSTMVSVAVLLSFQTTKSPVPSSKNRPEYATAPTARSALSECSIRSEEGRGFENRSFPNQTDNGPP